MWLGAIFSGTLWWQTQSAQLLAWPWLLGMAVLALALLLVGARLHGLMMRNACVALATALLAWVYVSALAHWRLADELPLALEGRDLIATGMVKSLPNHGAQSTRFIFEWETLQFAQPLADQTKNQTGQTSELLARVPKRILLSWWQPEQAIHAGERWRLTLRLRRPYGMVNPGGFDFEQYLFEKNIRATGTVRKGEHQWLPCTGWCQGLDRLREYLRERIARALSGQRHAATILALVVGDASAIDDTDWSLYRRTGITHLISISGLHITMFAWMMAQLVGLVWNAACRWRRPLALRWPRQFAAALTGLLAALLYAMLTGMDVPVQRTVIMLLVVTLIRLGSLDLTPLKVWQAALFAVLLYDPWSVMRPGFWLSFLGVAILFGSSPKTAQVLGPAQEPLLTPTALPAAANAMSWWQHVWHAVHAQLLISLAMIPLTALYFGQVSWVSPLANLLVVAPFSLLITPLAVLSILLPAPFSDWGWQFAEWMLRHLLAMLAWLFEQAPVWWTAEPNFWSGLLALLGMLLCSLRWPWALRLSGVVLMLPVLLWRPATPAPGQVEIWFADVGQGGGVLVRTHAHDLLFDAGPRYGLQANGGERVLLPLMHALGVDKLERVVASHRDSDHVGGLAAVLDAYPQAQVWTSMAREEFAYPSTLAWQPCIRGQRWQWDGVEFEFRNPPAERLQSQVASNRKACVLQIKAANMAVLLTADIGTSEEQELLADGQMRLDVLQVAHHGSRYSSSAAFLAAVQAPVAVIQVGINNPFGHPHPDVLQRLHDQGARVLRTDACGAVRLTSATQWQSRRVEQARYWRQAAAAECQAHSPQPNALTTPMNSRQRLRIWR